MPHKDVASFYTCSSTDLVQFLMSLNRIPLAFAVTSNIFGVSGSFYSAKSENLGREFFDLVYPVFRGPTSGGLKSIFQFPKHRGDKYIIFYLKMQ